MMSYMLFRSAMIQKKVHSEQPHTDFNHHPQHYLTIKPLVNLKKKRLLTKKYKGSEMTHPTLYETLEHAWRII